MAALGIYFCALSSQPSRLSLWDRSPYCKVSCRSRTMKVYLRFVRKVPNGGTSSKRYCCAYMTRVDTSWSHEFSSFGKSTVPFMTLTFLHLHSPHASCFCFGATSTVDDNYFFHQLRATSRVAHVQNYSVADPENGRYSGVYSPRFKTYFYSRRSSKS